MIAIVALTGVTALISSHFPLPAWNAFHSPSAIQSTPVISQQIVDAKLGLNNAHPVVHQPLPKKPPSTSASPVVSGGSAVNGCSLSLSITPNSSTIVSGGSITYKLILKNNGQSTCQNTSYSFYYSANEKYISATPKPSASNYYWRIGTLNPGAEYNATLSTQHDGPIEENKIKNEACATADNAYADACVDTIISVGTDNLSTPVAPQQTTQASATTPTLVHTTSSAPIPVTHTCTLVPGKEFGIWVWDSPLQMSATKMDQVILFAQQNCINAMYITIDDYLKIAALPSSANKNAQAQTYFAALNYFITQAHKAGIAVDVEGGASNWANTNNRWKGYALIDFVKQYNQQYPDAKIRALQYDVESYLLPSYENNKSSTLTSFVAFIDSSAAKMQSADAGFSVVIPHFYDSTQKWTPPIFYNGKTAYTFTHLLNVLQQKPDSTIIIMSYRNFFDGSDGVQGLSIPELTESSKQPFSTKVIIAQEVGDVSPSYVTFYGMSKSDYLDAVHTIYSRFEGFSSFKGVSTNYLDPFMQLQ
jgi:hypothetical protein